MWWISVIGIPVLVIAVTWFYWRKMEREEAAKRARRKKFRETETIPTRFEATLETLRPFQEAVANELAMAWQRLKQKHPDRELYGMAINLDDDILSYYISANGMEDVQAELRERSQQSGTPVEDLSFALYDVTHWEHEDNMDSLDPQFHDPYIVFRGDNSRKHRVDCFFNAVKSFKESGAADELLEHPDCFLSIWIHDTFDQQWVIDAARRLNPRETALQFAQENFGPNQEF